MSRVEFMRQLESLLQNISPTEREEAIQYYNDYFDDAGSENEQAVIEALGNPFKVAENIKKDLYSNGAYVENANRAVVPYHNEDGNASGGSESYYSTGAGNTTGFHTNDVGTAKYNGSSGKNGGLSTGMIVLIIVLCLLASPLLLGIASSLLGVLISIIAAWFSLIIGFGAAALALLVVFVVLAVVAVICMFTEPLVAVALLGGGMVCGGIGILFLMLTVAMAGIATPAAFRGIVGLVKKCCGKKQTV